MRQNQKRRKGKYQMKKVYKEIENMNSSKKRGRNYQTTHLAILMNRSISEGATCIPAWKHVITTQFTSQVQNPSCLTTGLFQSYQFSRKFRKKPSTEWYTTIYRFITSYSICPPIRVPSTPFNYYQSN